MLERVALASRNGGIPGSQMSTEWRATADAWLRDVLLDAARSGEAFQVAADAWGSHWRLDATIWRQRKRAVVRTLWIVRTGESVPRFVTCWVL